MKTTLFSSLLFILLICSCTESGDNIISKPTITGDSLVTINFNTTTNTSYSLSCSSSWTITGYDESALTISPTSGNAETKTLSICARNVNCTNEDAAYTFTINAGTGIDKVIKKVKVNQPPVFEIESTEYTIDASGGMVQVIFNTNIDTSHFCYACDNEFYDMLDKSDNAKSRTSSQMIQSANIVKIAKVGDKESKVYSYEADFNIKPNETDQARVGTLMFADSNNHDLHSADIKVSQESASASSYKSTDYSQDGKVYTLQSHTQGTTGFNIVFMGDGFLDTDIADGSYLEAMKRGVEEIFSQEPMTSLRDYCNVYYVNAVSSQDFSVLNRNTSFSCTFEGGTSTQIYGDNDKVLEYARKVVSDNSLMNALVVVLIKSANYAGTTYLYTSSTTKQRNDVACGVSLAYIPLIGDKYEAKGVTEQMILQHEAVGHGIGKLGDEYSYEEMGAIDSKDLDSLLAVQDTYKMYLNVTNQSDVTKSPWAKFAADETYAGEAIRCYLGAYTYSKGLYRSVDNGLMNTGKYFQAPDRVLIYKRIMNVANNYKWTYDYNTFRTFDAPGISEYLSNNARHRIKGTVSTSTLPRLAKPVIMHMRR